MPSAAAADDDSPLTLVLCGHVDAGKATLTRRLRLDAASALLRSHTKGDELLVNASDASGVDGDTNDSRRRGYLAVRQTFFAPIYSTTGKAAQTSSPSPTIQCVPHASGACSQASASNAADKPSNAHDRKQSNSTHERADATYTRKTLDCCATLPARRRRVTLVNPMAFSNRPFLPSLTAALWSGRAAPADGCLLVISARMGEFESAAEPFTTKGSSEGLRLCVPKAKDGGVTASHVAYMRTCRVPFVIVVVGKMDTACPTCQQSFPTAISAAAAVSSSPSFAEDAAQKLPPSNAREEAQQLPPPPPAPEVVLCAVASRRYAAIVASLTPLLAANGYETARGNVIFLPSIAADGIEAANISPTRRIRLSDDACGHKQLIGNSRPLPAPLTGAHIKPLANDAHLQFEPTTQQQEPTHNQHVVTPPSTFPTLLEAIGSVDSVFGPARREAKANLTHEQTTKESKYSVEETAGAGSSKLHTELPNVFSNASGEGPLPLLAIPVQYWAVSPSLTQKRPSDPSDDLAPRAASDAAVDSSVSLTAVGRCEAGNAAVGDTVEVVPPLIAADGREYSLFRVGSICTREETAADSFIGGEEALVKDAYEEEEEEEHNDGANGEFASHRLVRRGLCLPGDMAHISLSPLSLQRHEGEEVTQPPSPLQWDIAGSSGSIKGSQHFITRPTPQPTTVEECGGHDGLSAAPAAQQQRGATCPSPHPPIRPFVQYLQVRVELLPPHACPPSFCTYSRYYEQQQQGGPPLLLTAGARLTMAVNAAAVPVTVHKLLATLTPTRRRSEGRPKMGEARSTADVDATDTCNGNELWKRANGTTTTREGVEEEEEEEKEEHFSVIKKDPQFARAGDTVVMRLEVGCDCGPQLILPSSDEEAQQRVVYACQCTCGCAAVSAGGEGGACCFASGVALVDPCGIACGAHARGRLCAVALHWPLSLPPSQQHASTRDGLLQAMPLAAVGHITRLYESKKKSGQSTTDAT